MKASQSPQPSTRMDLLKILSLASLICACASIPQSYEAPPAEDRGYGQASGSSSGGGRGGSSSGGSGGYGQSQGGGYRQNQGGSGGGYGQTSEGMPYDFQWEVNDPESGNQYSHQQSSDGSITQGQYRVLLPDGRIQTVVFLDNGNGYEAQVTYEGEAQFPQTSGGGGGYGQSGRGGGVRQRGSGGGSRQGGAGRRYNAPSSQSLSGQNLGGYSQGESNQESGGYSQQSGVGSRGYSQQQSGGGGGGYGETSAAEAPSTSYEQPQSVGGYQ